eukprot:CAMPEP_0181363504 /NCGR_PEP_ID=MMETSP1106-20121128/8783_1 /TAXON_ID=81844 /ORGANISM="Mantoniella antarctica, Strain SL-175" /LENGTH=239 /DNA_ID=CAMNT_0023477945 /DNA_START=209 /DNA_END=928 /DNA_ORIENTATION=-
MAVTTGGSALGARTTLRQPLKQRTAGSLTTFAARAPGSRGSGLRVMSRGKSQESSTSKDTEGSRATQKGKEIKNSNSDGKDQRKTGTAVATSPPAAMPVPLPVLGGGILLALVILGKVIGGRGNKGSVSALEERGTLDENRGVDEEKFYKGMMKQVRTVEMPALSDAQIQAARDRRRQSHFAEEGSPRQSLENVSIPANHPWATTEKLTTAEKLEQEQRVREMNKPRTRQRGTPPPPAV